MISCIIFLFLISSGDLSDYRGDLKKLETELKETRVKLKKTEREEKSLLREIEYIDREEKILRSILELIEKRKEEVEGNIDNLESGILKADSILNSSLDRLKMGLNFLYIYGAPDWKDYLSSSVSIYDAYRKIKMVERVISFEKEFYGKVLKAKHTLVEYIDIRRRDLIELASLREEARRKTEELTENKRKKEKLLKNLKEEEKLQERYVKELESSIEKLEELIAKLEREMREKLKKKGRIPEELVGKKIIWPVRGEVISRFGTVWHPVYKTKTKNNGIDIRAEPNSPVVTVETGKVVYAGYFLGYGNLVIIEHDGFFSLYAQLDKIVVKRGDRVLKGTVIGYLATEDSFTGPVLHFELRVGGKAVDPLRYLG